MSPNEPPILHITFGASGAGSLMQSLTTLGRVGGGPSDRIIFLIDDLTVGPIDPADPIPRRHWIDQELGLGYPMGEPEDDALIDAFWAEAAAADSSTIVWFSRRSASEYTGFLELMWRREGRPLRIVDVADVEFVGRNGLWDPPGSHSFSIVWSSRFIEHDLMRRARPISARAIAEARTTMQRLKKEDAALRVMTEAGLVSAPLTYFDDVITSCITIEWQRCARVIGDSLFKISDGSYRQCSDGFLWTRILARVEAGVLEGQGEFFNDRESFVRRPA